MSTTKNHRNLQLQSFYASPRLKPEPALMSPTSILDTNSNHKSLISPSKTKTPFWYNQDACQLQPSGSSKPSSEQKTPWGGHKGIGVATELNNSKNDLISQSEKMVVLASLRVQIPPLPSSIFSLSELSKSPRDIGTRTPSSSGSAVSESPSLFMTCMSIREMELSEEYTRVISRGPNPKTTHIFDNCVEGRYDCSASDKSNYESTRFLSFCHTCKKNLEENNDIYIYRGEKAFCSEECRDQEMLFDEMD